MRIVLKSHSEVAHKWANQSQPEGRSGNMFFEGPSIYSYGRHFEIARFQPKNVKTRDGRRVVLFTTRVYSVSTAKHKSYTARAIPGSDVFTLTVPDVTGSDHGANVAHFLKEYETARESAVKARVYGEMHKRAAVAAVSEAARYCAVFGKAVPADARRAVKALDKKRLAGALFTPAEDAKIRERLAASRAAEAAKKEKARAAEAERLAAWVAGSPDARGPFYNSPVALRWNREAERVETSRGAQITERTARALWAGMQRGAELAGLGLDGYRVNSWDGETLVVGCHDIPATELRRVAVLMGLTGA